MSEKRKLLRHFLAALAYRTQKALRGMPDGFEQFSPGSGVRTPHQLICHMMSVLGYARTFFIGGTFPPPKPTDWKNDLNAFHELLEDLGRYLDSDTPLKGTTEERMLQGPFADAMTHAGQLAMLRRFAGSPVRSENFIKADIRSNNLSADQPNPIAPDFPE
ncbi:MAG: hypothetical protein HY420_03610 [Candidatus Kerfeldbacteria bacterium]|nr:hypothetical protein [Candidatus Kerfeldbacteria bacterium]